MIRTNSDEYFIEPLEQGTQEHEEGGRVHVVYRRSAVLQVQSDISSDYQTIGMYHCITNVCCVSRQFLILGLKLTSGGCLVLVDCWCLQNVTKCRKMVLVHCV